MAIFRLNDDSVAFPPIHLALTDPNGLLAVGGDLSPNRLMNAYASGIFPWFEDDQPILWWSPDPRAVIVPADVKISRSLIKSQRKQQFRVSVDTAFSDVIASCSAPRSYADDTWITDEMQWAYNELHELGHAHSVEVWSGADLVGGLYGVSIGSLYFGESMFHVMTDASKVAFVTLCRMLGDAGCPLIDCQLPNPHLSSLGAIEIPRSHFEQVLLQERDAQRLNWTAMAEQVTMVVEGWTH